jgi:hypothetical protein
MKREAYSAGEYRINLIDQRGTVSLLSPPHGPKMLTALAGLEFSSTRDMLQAVSALDASWITHVQSQLAMFDEFNINALSEEWRQMIEGRDSAVHPAFRVIDSTTRVRSLQPASLGLIVFNLKEHRIIQVHNTGDDLERKGEGRYREDGHPQERMYSYVLPANWSLVP